MIRFENVADLAYALKNAANAHHRFEELTGKTDPNWETWYAEYLALSQSRPTPAV